MIVQTTDARLLTRILRDPQVFDWCCEDGIDRDTFEYRAHPGVIALLAMDGDRVEGAFLLHPGFSTNYELHTALLVKGAKAKSYGMELFDWVWRNTDAHRVTTSIADYNRGAVIMASLCGMTRYGENPESWLKNGKLHTILLYGKTRGL